SDVASCRRAESREHYHAERRILGRRWRAAASARGARALQRDLCCNRQAHPRAPAEEPRLAEGIAAVRASRISAELLARADRLIAAVHESATGHKADVPIILN